MTRALAERYHYTPGQVAQMTRAQQTALLETREGDREFQTQAEYDAWVAGLPRKKT